tara:strand:+ start:221 stop:583 length:363 start_codon:yes stop_codon:yes gene_type:complete
MTERTHEDIVQHIVQILEDNVAPAVASHGGVVNYHNFEDGILTLEMSGACSGCSSSTETLKYGIENMILHLVPEVKSVQGFDDPLSQVSPYFMNNDPFGQEAWENENIIPIQEDRDESNN